MTQKKGNFSNPLRRRQFKSSGPAKKADIISKDALKRRILHRRRLS